MAVAMEDVQVRFHAQMDIGEIVSNVSAIQHSFNKLKIPDKIGEGLNKNIATFMKEYEKYQKKISEGIKTQGDYNQVEKSLNTMRTLYQAIGKDAQKLTKLDMKDILNLDTKEFKKLSDDLTNIMKQIGSTKMDTTPFTKAFADIRKITKSSKVTGDNGILNQMIGNINTGQIVEAKKQLQELQAYAKKVAPRTTAEGKQAPGTLSVEKYQQLTAAINIMANAFTQADAAMAPLITEQDRLQRELEETKQKAANSITDEFSKYNQASVEVDRVTDSLKKMHAEEFSFSREVQNIDRQIQSYFGLSQMIRKVGDIAKDAFSTVKELDKAMTETAVVTNFNVGDMWNMLPTYTEQANQLGSTIKDVYEAATLYYQQGLNTNQAMSLANETLKMARIAGLGAAEATDMMTAALRGFNMEINQASAQKINDVYSELAAITASDTQEIGSAMERTASIANSANMEFETTSAFLAQMIETTREAPENLGTAMKTIVARFQEMKKDPTKLIDSEGIAMDANKVDTALKSIGVNLMDTKGEFRDLDDVFLDIASRWDSLTQGQQRYIATIAAGSRQQSRFIAMMSNYERTMELVDAANNSAGASQRQFEKTLDSMEAKLNKLKNAWDQFTMGLMNNQILKGGVDLLTGAFTIVNKFIDLLTKPLPDPFGGLAKSALTLVTTLGMLNLGKKFSRGLVMGGVGWWKNEGGFGQNFAQGWSGGKQMGQQGHIDGKLYVQAFKSELASGAGIKQALTQAMTAANTQGIYENTFQAAFGQFSAKEMSAAWSPKIEAEIRSAFARATANVDLTQYGIEDGDEYLKGLLGRIRTGQNSAGEEANILKLKTQGQVDLGSVGVNKLPTQQFDQLNASITKTGATLQQFGVLLQSTPLAPLGTMLSTIGMAFNTVGGQVIKFANIFMEGMGKVVAAEGMAASGTTMLAGGFSALFAEIWAFMTTNPIGWILLAIAGIAAAVKTLDAAIVTNKEKLEAATDAAAAASEAYDSAKQETSELADSISKIQETDSAFDNLVAGTAEFNDQLVTANEQIMALIDKYPMLMEEGKNFVTTDSNGLMHISQAGLDAVKEYQKQIQAQASAVNLIQTADLNALENLQKANDLRKKAALGKNAYAPASKQKEYEKNLKEADLLEQRAKAEVDLARQNAIRTALNGKELHDIDALTAVYSNLYDQKRKVAETEVSGLNKHDIRQQYADYHGYTYDRSTKKIKDVEGNEVDYKDEAIKDEVIEQTVLLDFEANAKNLEVILNNVDKRFSDTIKGTSIDSAHFISDVLSSNINANEDLLEKALSDNTFQDVVNSMSEKEMAAILGISAESIDETNISKYQQQIANLLSNKAADIAEAQSKSYEDLGVMLAKASGASLEQALSPQQQKYFAREIKDFTSEQAHMMSKIGSELESAGLESMEIYINQIRDLYETNAEAAEEVNEILNNVDLTTATGRLEAYTKLTKSSIDTTRKLGEALLNSTDSANILGEAFTEFMGEWEGELSENIDDFKNAMGEIDAAGIMEASKQSKTLNTLLESGQVSATGMAMALQGYEDGKYAVEDVNGAVLQLLSSMNRLADAAMKAHNIVENFDAGIDTGEGEDFVKDNAEKVKEFVSNGEWGNQQLQNYIKLAAGTEKWNETLKANHGDLQATTEDLKHYVTTFAEGFQPAWDQMIAGKNINGKSLSKSITDAVDANRISEDLAKKFEQVQVFWDDQGYMNVEVGDLTTSELESYFQEVYGVSKEYAELLLQDLANYDATVSSMLAKNDLKEAVQTGALKERQVGNNLVLTDAEIKTFEAAGGSLEELRRAAEEAGQTLSEFQVLDKDGNRIDNTDDPALLQNYIKTFDMAAKGSIESMLKTGSEKLFDKNGVFDLSKLVADTQAKGFNQEQAMQAAWQTYQRAQQLGEQVRYEGVDLEKGIATYEDFTASIESALESSKWESIGESIAQGIINYINSNKTDDKTKEPTESNAEAVEKKWADDSRAGQQKAMQDITGFFSSVASKLKKESEGAEVARNQKTFGGTEVPTKTVEKGTTGEQTKTSLQEASTQITASANTLNDAGSTLAKAASDLSGAATNLNGAASSLKTTNAGKITGKGSSGTPATKGTTGGNLKTPTSANVKINYIAGNLPKIKDAKAKINYTIGKQDKPKDKSAKVNYSLGSQDKPKDKTAKVNYQKAAKGKNNYIPYRPIINTGSLASGSRYGRVGPKDKGGLTLTGEEGFEIAWLPSENRSMILGAQGPQMVNLPKNAVVYTHEQSEDILKKRQTIDAGSHAKTGRKKSSSSSSSKSKKSKSKSKSKSKKKKKKGSDTKETINNFSMEEVVRFNIDQKLATLTDAIAKRTKEIEKTLSKIGTTYGDIAQSTKNQVSALQDVKSKNQDLLASYQRQLADYRSRQAIVSYTDSKGESHDKKINIASYLNADGSANEAAIRAAGGREVQEAIFNEINSVKGLVDGINNANKAIADADEQIADLGKKISEAFFQWKNELTKVYDLTQRINNETSLADRFTSQISLELAKLGAGFGDTASAIQHINDVIQRSNKTIQEQVANQQKLIEAREEELDLALSASDELETLKKYQNMTDVDSATKKANVEWAEQQLTAALSGRKYVTGLQKLTDGSIQYDIDWAQFERDNDQSPMSVETYNAIKKYLDDLNSAATEFNNSIKDQTEFIKQTYDALKEYQETLGSFEETLIDGIEEQNENRADDLKSLSDTISNTLKDLLDEVKRRLQERRQAEDNAKTEDDIAKKQQRLAALQASTSGANAVEIAQLQKEISEAQQSYQRTLEDQLLEKLEQQNDEAARQRERLIELSQNQLDISGQTNKELVDMWLRDPERYKKEIYEAWKAANDYDSKGEVGQFLLDNKFDSEFADMVTAVEQTGFANHFKAIEGDTSTLVGLLQNSSLFNDAVTDVTKRNGPVEQGTLKEETTVKDYHDANVDAKALKSLYSVADLLGGGYSGSQIRNAGFSAKEAREGGINTVGGLRDAGYTASELRDMYSFSELYSAYGGSALRGAGFTGREFKDNNVSYANAKAAGFTKENLAGIYAEADAEIAAEQAYRAAVNTYTAAVQAAHKKKTVTKASLNDVFQKGWAIGYDTGRIARDLAAGDGSGGVTWLEVVKAAKKLGYGKGTVKAWSPGSSTLKKAVQKVYATGGLADYTGMAWLDGTPSKPELVLNAQDTKNFLALKDVLSHAMGTTNHIDNSYGGDNTFEININVDKIANDYDVDKMAQRIKKIIVKDSSYRNVTQVRNLR